MEDTNTNINETNHDEEQRRKLQEYIFDLEEAQDKTEELSAAHRDLKHSQDLLLSLLRGTIHGICLIRDRKFVWCNEAFGDILGWEQSKLIGTTTEIIYPSLEEYERMGEVSYGDPYRVGLITYEYDFLHSDGHRVPCLVTGRALDQNDPDRGYVFSFTDVTEQKRARESLNKTYEELEQRNADLMIANEELNKEIGERKQAEEALRESEERYRRIFENIQDVYYESSLDGTILEVSPSIENVSQYKRKELIGRSLYDIYTNPKERDRFLRLILDKGKVNDFEISLTDKDGSKHPCSITTLLVKDKQGNPVKLVGSMRDISERKQSEDERKRLEAQLQQAQKMEAIGTLAGGIAHDFNNILMAIIGHCDLAKMKLAKDCEAIDNLNEARNGGNRARRLIQQILAFSRMGEQEMIPLSLTPLIREALKFLKSTIPTSVEIRDYIEADPGIIEADATQIHQIVMNLCTNAEHAMREEGGTLDVRLTRVEVDKQMALQHHELHTGPHVRLTVTDTGCGMDLETLEHIFDPYFTTKDVVNGTGLGLSVVHGIVNTHGGAITVKSEPGKGTTFKVYFPIIEKDAEMQEESTEPLPTGNEHVLFIDDEPVLVDMARQMLESLGYEVTTKSGSLEALNLFREQPNRFDLVITDTTMPHMTGDTLAEEFMKIRADIPIILCTGYSRRISEEKAKGMGIKAFAMKPLAMRALAVTVRKVLDG